MKHTITCICLLLLGVAKAQESVPPTPHYNPTNPVPYVPATSQTLPEGYQHISPQQVTMLMDTSLLEAISKTTFFLDYNPTKKHVALSWNWFEEGIDSSFDIHIISMQGKVVAKHKVPDCKTNSKLLPIDHLTPGMYMIEVLGANGSKLFVGNWFSLAHN
jgi:hypothetical protein